MFTIFEQFVYPYVSLESIESIESLDGQTCMQDFTFNLKLNSRNGRTSRTAFADAVFSMNIFYISVTSPLAHLKTPDVCDYDGFLNVSQSEIQVILKFK